MKHRLQGIDYRGFPIIDSWKRGGLKMQTGEAQRNIFALLRITLGAVWALNAWLQARGPRPALIMQTLADNAAAATGWVHNLIETAMNVITWVGPTKTAVLMVILDGLIALSLMSGVAVRLFAWIGIIYSCALWAVFESFGGPYGPGTTDPGAGIAYAIAFLFVLLARSGERLCLIAPFPGGRGYRSDIPERALQDRLRFGMILFGLLWAFDALWKWQPYFLSHTLGMLVDAQSGEPSWIVAYIGLFVFVVKAIGPLFFGIVTALIESFIAVNFLFGTLISIAAPLSFFWSVGIWTTAEAWGGPYAPGSTGTPEDILGTSIIYAYISLYLVASRIPIWYAGKNTGAHTVA
jgi:hypothetical protein